MPEIIESKREILKDHLSYEQIGCSVLDTKWIDKVTSAGNGNFLLIAEGLFMYLPKPEAARILQEISQRFNRSQFVLDMAPQMYTRGFWHKFIAWQFKLFLGVDAPWVFGLKDTRDFESYGSSFKVIDDKGPKGWFMITASVNDGGTVGMKEAPSS